jgi:hypothetical protein
MRVPDCRTHQLKAKAHAPLGACALRVLQTAAGAAGLCGVPAHRPLWLPLLH